uniref:Uncharacterized protein n=1 Tax=Pavo cristatus TaxID=9049 RepID=A0A8C9G305_PAVCR
MFPNSSSLGRPPFPPKHLQQNNFLNKVPLNIRPVLSHQQIINAQINFQNPLAYGNGSPVNTSVPSPTFRGKKRLSEHSVPFDVKRQRYRSPRRETPVVNQAVPSPEESACLFSGSSPLFSVCYVPDLSIRVPRLQDISFPDVTETTLPVAKDKVLSFCDRV